MRKRVVRNLAIVAAVVMIAGCANDDGGVDSTTTSVVEVDLPAALLTPDDLGEGWMVTERPAADGPAIDGAVTEEQQGQLPHPELCDEADAAARQTIGRLAWQAFRSLELNVPDPIRPPIDRSGHLVFLQELLHEGPVGEQRAMFDLMRDGYRDCLGDIPAGDEGPGRAEELPLPQLGDDRFGVLITIEEAGGWAEWRLHQVVVLDGTVLMSMILGDIRSVDVEPWFTTDAVGDIATTALERIRSRTSP